MIVAKNSYAHHLLDQQLQKGSLNRNYIAVLEGKLASSSGVLEFPIGKPVIDSNKRAVTANGETAITKYQVINSTEDHTLVSVAMETGRTHQIRVHFSHIGHPLVGDTLYGRRSSAFTRQALHSYQVSFLQLDTNTPMTVTADYPEDLKTLINSLALQ